MKRSLRFVSLTVLLFLGIQVQTSCSPRISGEGSTMPPIIELTQGEGSQKYNIQLDFMKHHMSGMLIVRRMPDNEIRIVASTPGDPAQIKIKHPWIRLTIRLDKLSNEI